MRKTIIYIIAFLLTKGSIAQDLNKHESGKFELGLRTTVSAFGENGANGFGTGGQFRLMLGKKLNTEWFADFIQNDLSGLGKRNDAHIGWSVMFYFLDEPKFYEPYLVAGHCFDYTKVTPFSTLTEDRTQDIKSRWSSAAQLGFGNHFYINERFNLSLAAQYMVHLGKDIHTEIEEKNGQDWLHVDYETTNNKLTLEGHLLITLSLNVTIADLW